MKVQYIAQPDNRLGVYLTDVLDQKPEPNKLVIVSAFVALQTIMRLKLILLELAREGTAVHLVIGVDMGGTSKEVLQELSSWGIPVTIVKNRLPGHTFHPKVYMIEWQNRAVVLVGSNNLTEGGLYRNYEGMATVEYELPSESKEFEQAQVELKRFFEPEGETARKLDAAYLALLLESEYIPTEQEAREQSRRSAVPGKSEKIKEQKDLFGREEFPSPPPLPASILEGLAIYVKKQREDKRKTTSPKKPTEKPPLDQIAPASFYMTLPTLQGRNIPGEARIPLAAIEMAEEFWGWPEKYTEKKSPRGGEGRVYHDWKPVWEIWDFAKPEKRIRNDVRMYMYDNSSDFRFYAKPLVVAGGDLGDVVRITRVAQPDVEFECVLARKGTATYRKWIGYCTIPVTNSDRLFGYG